MQPCKENVDNVTIEALQIGPKRLRGTLIGVMVPRATAPYCLVSMGQ
jgi:hypothetical protein